MQTYTLTLKKYSARNGPRVAPAQAITCAFSKQTGVTTPVGAPKLELLADQIATVAKRENVDPLKMRDDVLSGKKNSRVSRPGAASAFSRRRCFSNGNARVVWG